MPTSMGFSPIMRADSRKCSISSAVSWDAVTFGFVGTGWVVTVVVVVGVACCVATPV
jgi:hypothetical protein